MAWEVEVTDEVRDWYWGLDDPDMTAVEQVIEVLEQRGPALGRPLVGEIDTSREKRGGRIHNMKELRPTASLRILFVFDPRRTAILLIAGDKAGDWKGWYRTAIPAAERLYGEHIDSLQREGKLG
jgi:hypothetical protein